MPIAEDPIDPKKLREAAEFLASMDGQERDPEALVKLATPHGRISFAIFCISQKHDAHRYRALFDMDYRARTKPGLERLSELQEEFDKLFKQYHREAIIYYFGNSTEGEITKIETEDKSAVEIQLGYGSDSQGESEFGPGSDDWKKGYEDNDDSDGAFL